MKQKEPLRKQRKKTQRVRKMGVPHKQSRFLLWKFLHWKNRFTVPVSNIPSLVWTIVMCFPISYLNSHSNTLLFGWECIICPWCTILFRGRWMTTHVSVQSTEHGPDEKNWELLRDSGTWGEHSIWNGTSGCLNWWGNECLKEKLWQNV